MLTWLRRSAPTARPALLAVITGACCAVMFATHRAGHWWGDDWALYIRQAQGLLDLEPGAVLDSNRFTVDSSMGPPFSPQLYPWGLPIMLAPFVAAFGVDLDRLTIVPVLCAAVTACCWYSLMARRIGRWVALLAIPALLLTPLLVSWSELIQSEWPFLATAFTALAVLDRLAADDGRLIATSGRITPLVGLGLLVACAFSVRREGLALVPAVAAAQIAALLHIGPRALLQEPRLDQRHRLIRLLVPHLTALAAVLSIQVLLPSPLVPKYDGTGLHNVWKFRRRHVNHIAEIVGLKRSYEPDPRILGQEWLGWTAVVVLLTLATVGIVLAVVAYRRRDLHLAVYAIVALMIGGSFRSAINRYLATVAPIVLLLAFVPIVAALKRARWNWIAPSATTALLLALVAGNISNANVRIDQAAVVAASGRVEWGPTDPAAIEMFEMVQQLTKPGDVIGAPKARAMALMTGRLTVQVDEYRPVPDGVRVSFVVVERNSKTETALSADVTRFTRIWANSRFLLYEQQF